MENYDELIKALRYCRTSNCCQICPSDRKDIVWTVDECIDKLHNDAADAIERMQTELTEAKGYIDSLKSANKNMFDDVEKLHVEVEHWKQAWWSAYQLYEEGKRKPYEPKRPN